uniref:Uncharacterized protein n=1 Tax=Romanomermis culicivorax TaxID=13658 RepID=A0A915JMK8_ROMCU
MPISEKQCNKTVLQKKPIKSIKCSCRRNLAPFSATDPWLQSLGTICKWDNRTNEMLDSPTCDLGVLYVNKQ